MVSDSEASSDGHVSDENLFEECQVAKGEADAAAMPPPSPLIKAISGALHFICAGGAWMRGSDVACCLRSLLIFMYSNLCPFSVALCLVSIDGFSRSKDGRQSKEEIHQPDFQQPEEERPDDSSIHSARTAAEKMSYLQPVLQLTRSCGA